MQVPPPSDSVPNRDQKSSPSPPKASYPPPPHQKFCEKHPVNNEPKVAALHGTATMKLEAAFTERSGKASSSKLVAL